jgi:hypothetical protein
LDDVGSHVSEWRLPSEAIARTTVGPIVNLGQLFSNHFLREGIRTTTAYERLTSNAAQDTLPAFRAALVTAFDGFPHASQPDEASTEQDLIFRVLEPA